MPANVADVTADDLRAMARWLAASIPHARRLRAQQRHEGADRSAHGVAQIVRTLRREQTNHGFFADLWFADLFAEADRLFAEFEIKV